MGQKTVYYTLNTDKSLDQVKQAAHMAFGLLGGTVYEHGDGLQIKQGVNGVSNAFTANFEAFLNIKQLPEEKYELFCTIKWSPNALFWICLIVGFFVLGILWIVPLLYLFINPESIYQQTLFRIQNFLD